MKAKFLIFASIFLCGCGQDAAQSAKHEDLQADSPKLITINHFSLPLDTSGNQEKLAGETILSDDSREYANHDHEESKDISVGTAMNTYSTEEVTGIEGLSVKVNEIYSDISSIWNTTFVPMYNQYTTSGISNDDVAETLEVMHEEYQALERQVQGIKTPEYFTPDHVVEVEELKSDLSLAISNRTLALIEFKLMNATENVKMHSELLDIHKKNSLKYMGSAEEHMETLENMQTDDHSAVDEELITTK